MVRPENFPITREEFVREALKYVDYPSMHYKGHSYGQDERGFDCSGFVSFVLKRIGIPVSPEIRHSDQFFDYFGILVHEGLQERGDLVFFSYNRYANIGVVPTHMGILISKTHYVHSPGRDGERVKIAELKKEDIEPSSGQIYKFNPIGFKRPAVKDGRYHKVLALI